jgi:hypothetical protein
VRRPRLPQMAVHPAGPSSLMLRARRRQAGGEQGLEAQCGMGHGKGVSRRSRSKQG